MAVAEEYEGLVSERLDRSAHDGDWGDCGVEDRARGPCGDSVGGRRRDAALEAAAAAEYANTAQDASVDSTGIAQ